MALLNAGAPLPHVRSGEFKAYAVSAKRVLLQRPVSKRNSTVVSAPIIAKLNAATVETLANPSVRARLGDWPIGRYGISSGSNASITPA